MERFENLHPLLLSNRELPDRSGWLHLEVVALAENTGFANAANIGVERAASPYVALLNADTRAYPDWLSSLLQRMEKAPPDMAAINSQLRLVAP